MPPKGKKADKGGQEETLTRVAIVSADRWACGRAHWVWLAGDASVSVDGGMKRAALLLSKCVELRARDASC